MKERAFLKYRPVQFSEEESMKRSIAFRKFLDTRRSIRCFSDQAVSKEIIENIIMTASSSPSGAHKQPWFFCAVGNEDLKKKIRAAAEKEEYENYHGRMSDEWLKDLEKFETDHVKEFLEVAPWIIVVFKKTYDVVNQERHKNYYVTESVGIACGLLIAAIHNAGLVTLTHTPSPMNFLQEILKRPENEKPYLLLPIGYPKENVEVPDLKRKENEEVLKYFT